MIIDYEDHLEHHGVKGQRWGVVTKSAKSVGKKIIGPKKSERDAAKKRHEARLTSIDTVNTKLALAKNKKQKDSAKALLHKIGNNKLAMSDSKMAYTTSRGTRLATALLANGLTLGVLKVGDYTRRHIDRNRINAARNA